MRIRVAGALAIALCATGCMVGPKYTKKDLAIHSHWTAGESPAVVAGAPETPAAWWENFQDPVLAGLVQDALGENLDIEAAGLRVVQARSSKVRAKDLLFPIVRPEAGYGRKYLSQNVQPDVDVSGGDVSIARGSFAVRDRPDLGIITPPSVTLEKPEVSLSNRIDVYSVGTTALWEPDLWGQTRRRMKSAAARFDAAIAAYDAVVVVIASEVASTYIQMRTVDARIEQLERGAAQLGELVQASGGPSTDTGNHELASSLLADANARLVDLRAARAEYENALCYLLGKLPGSLTERLAPTSAVPVPPASIAIGVPADLLRRRPDIREAERLAAAQSERVGITKAGLYPSFTLLGSIGYAASSTGDLFDPDSLNGAYGAGVSWNILLYPFIQEKARMEEAAYQEAMVNLENAVIRAATEAESALGSYLRSREKREWLRESALAADTAAQERLARAQSDPALFDPAYTAIEHQLAQNDKHIDAMGAQALGMVRLYAALGGGWEVQAGVPFVKETTREEMRERTDWSSFSGKRGIEATR